MSFGGGTPRLDGIQVLVVEGVAEVREVVVDALEAYGARVTAVDSAVRAHRQAR